ncbi:uncharacterized protein EV422DRAFT_240947 [Fimicolochytrium jonesii]|uniref:uncharacterized protein n=1 Tax=Fimicolochytrium jonesii TaxID=1396493 RepID=UPI0022FECCAD|nr:uncharacterized protein EV422DRAFT_240947 [Fimicolochytrium jonesii]KAI8825000.1 hypothetical protein EV422DRAFT_240947 [Fimicolochytrium jonesii]
MASPPSLFDELFLRRRPSQPGSVLHPFLREPGIIGTDEEDRFEGSPLSRKSSLAKRSAEDAAGVIREGGRRPSATPASPASSGNGEVRRPSVIDSRKGSLSHIITVRPSVGASQRLSPVDASEEGAAERTAADALGDLGHVHHHHHFPQPHVPVRSHSADEQIVTPPVPARTPTVQWVDQSSRSPPLPTRTPSNESKESKGTSTADLPSSPTVARQFGVIGTQWDPSTAKARPQMTSIARILASGTRFGSTAADNDLTVRTAPPGFDMERRGTTASCSTCDGKGGEPPAKEWKDQRSEHTMISGFVNADMLKLRDFLIKLSRAFAMYGAPSHRLEFHLRCVADALEVEGNFFVMPGMILISFGNDDHSSSTHLVRAPQGFNMWKLSAINMLCRQLTEGQVLIQEALDRLVEIRSQKEYKSWVFLSTFPVSSWGIAIIGFNANWGEALMAAILATMVGLFSLAAERLPSFTYLLEFFSALVVGILVRGYKHLSGDGCVDETVVTLSALAILLPGLSLTISIIEISTRNMVSGCVRLFHALFTAMLLGFGMSVGPLLIDSENKDMNRSATCTNFPSQYWFFLFYPMMAVAICIFFQARPKQWPIMIFVSVLGFVTYFFLNKVDSMKNNGGQIPMVLSALAIGLASNIYARISHDLAVAPILSGILLLVPGSLGVRSTLGFLGITAGSGTNFAFQMLIIGLSITIGLFVATLLVWPIRGPKLKYMTF